MIAAFLTQYGYHSFLGIGAISMVVLTLWRQKQYSFSQLQAICFPLLLLMCGITGAKLLYFMESGFTSFSGMSFFGAVYLVMLAMPILGLLFRMKPMRTLDACAPCVASIIGFMRFGCFCAGCCGGVMGTIGSLRFRWPTQLIEGFCDMLILALLLNLEQRSQKQGLLYPVFLIAYGVMRFMVEFLRDTPKEMMGFSEGQWLALSAAMIGLLWIWVVRKSGVKNGSCA